MKRCIILLTVMMLKVICIADNLINEPATIPTPNTTALAQYGIIPMSLYTGKANVTIPLFNSTLRGINLDMSLLYDTSGLLVNSLPSWTGHSWTLNVGGVITRAVKGYPDEFDKTNHTHINGWQYWQNYFHRYNGNINDSQEVWGDYMPDIFYFSFMGKSGKFFLGNDGEWKVASDDNLMVEFNINDPNNYILPFIEVLPNKRYSQPKSIKGFTIVDQEGNRYVFGGSREQNASEYSIDLREDNDGGDNGDAHAEMYANSWYLTAVYDRYGKLIYNFEYTRGLFLITSSVCYQQTMPKMMITSPVYLSKITTYDGTSIDFIKDTLILTSTDFYYRLYNGKTLQTLYQELKSWQNGDNWSQCFIYLSDSDYSMYQNPNNTNKQYDPLKSMGLSPLKEIRISKNNSLCQKYIFYYNYSCNIRLHLRSIDIKNNNGGTDGVYTFTYNNFDRLPIIGGHCDYLTTSSDHWGYYNGSTGNDKEVNPIYSHYGMLSEIQYPTGGVTTIEYGNHWYNSYRNPYHDGMVYIRDLSQYNGAECLIAGGLRVERLANYENDNKDKLLSEHVFFYYDGQLSTLPVIKFIYDNSIPASYKPYMPVPMANIFGYHIGYSSVLETIYSENESQRLYEYSNFSDYREESCWNTLSVNRNNGNVAARINEMVAAYDEWTERDYMRGRLLYYAIRNHDDSEWASNTYIYRTDSINRENNYVIGYFDKSRSHYCDYGSASSQPASYRLFYSKYDVVQKTEKTKYDWASGFLTDITTYTMSDYTINLSNGYSHKGEMRLCDSEAKSRSGNVIKHNYQYLFSGYFAPVISTREYRNNTFVKESQVEYGDFNINSTIVKLPKKEKTIYPSQQISVVRNYTQYNSSYLPVRYTNKLEQEVILNWDTYDRLLSHTIGNQTTSYEYNNYGLVSKITQPNGYELNYEYDSMQRLSGVKDENGSYLNKYKYNYRTGVPEE